MTNQTHLGLLMLSLGTACTEDPLTSPPATGPGPTGSPTSFDPGPTAPTGTDEPTTTGTTGTSSTGEPSTSSTTAPDGAACGDGIVAGLEECDLGPDNRNTGACTLECKHATCGDGLVWAGVEACDFGLGNGHGYGGCHPADCQFGPHCGDGILDLEHETCDRGALNGTGITDDDFAPCSHTCGFFGRIMFVTSQAFVGALGGVSGGDLKCRNAALAAGLPDPLAYRAWLSDEAMSPLHRFAQWETPGVPIILISGRVVAGDFAELADFGPRTGIARTELGEIVFDKPVWTNTSAFGEVFSATHHCAGWTSNSDLFKARTGLNALAVEAGPDWQTWRDERQWTSYLAPNCSKIARLYCIDDGVILEHEE